MNYYQILQIPTNASKQQIKNSYKKLVKQYHPDLYVGDKNFAEQKIIQINEAYEVLSTLEKKLEYDESLKIISNSTAVPTSSIQNSASPASSDKESKLFSKFILEKLNKLEKKQQLELFILLLLFILALFLLNLIQTKNYFYDTQNNPNTTHFIENRTQLEPNTSFENFQSLEDLVHEFFKNHEEDFHDLEDLF